MRRAGEEAMSLNIEQHISENAVIILSGRLDTSTAPQLEETIDRALPQINSLTINLADTEYVSSAGLRVILKAYKALVRKGGLKLKNVRENVQEVFDITGFSDFLVIE